MTVDSTTPIRTGNRINDYTVVTMTNGLAHAYVYYFPKKTPHVKVILTTTGVAPSYLINIDDQANLAFDMPQSLHFCQIDYDDDIDIAEVQVYKKGTEPIFG
jgi:hypothetical protein